MRVASHNHVYEQAASTKRSFDNAIHVSRSPRPSFNQLNAAAKHSSRWTNAAAAAAAARITDSSAATVHQCPEPGCNRRFTRKYTLTEHLKTHTGEKPHACPVRTCSKRFSTSGNLARHKRLHGYIEPLPCPVDGCVCTFPSDIKLEKHMKFHYGGPVQACEVLGCGKTFSTTGNLNRHMKNHHSGSIPPSSGAQTPVPASGVHSSASTPTSEELQYGPLAVELRSSDIRSDTIGNLGQLDELDTPGRPNELDDVDELASILSEEVDFAGCLDVSVETEDAPSAGASDSQKGLAPAVAEIKAVTFLDTKHRQLRRTLLDDMVSFHVSLFG